MKTFEEVQNELEEWEKDCLMKTSDFIDDMESGFFTEYDGFGRIHDGNEFVTDEYKISIFDFIIEKLVTIGMDREEFVKKYPYVAWYNK